MRRVAYFIGITIVVSCLLVRHDYHNYFHGNSFINYKSLPQNLSPFYFKTYVKANGKINNIRYFCFTYNDCGEFIGYGSEIPTNSNNSQFVIQNIVSYYYNSNDILIQCIDIDGNMHWIKPFHYKSQLYFKEVTGIEKFDLLNYKYVKISN